MRDEAVDLWATDEVHFQQHGSRCRMWVAPEIKDPVLQHAPTRKSVGYFGAVRLRDGRFLFRREEGQFNGATFLRFLRHLRRSSIRAGRRIVVIADNARYRPPASTRTGEKSRHPDSLWTFFQPTARS
jgi:hypothetical protein